MESATVTIQLEPADLTRFNRFAGGGQMNWRGLVLFVVAILLIWGSFLLRKPNIDRRAEIEIDRAEETQGRSSASILPAVLPVVLFAGIFIFFYRQAKRNGGYEATAPGIFQPNTYEVIEAGLRCRSERGETLNFWPVITRFVETDEDFYVMLAARNGHVLPKRCFSTREAAAIFTNQIRMHLARHAPAALAAR